MQHVLWHLVATYYYSIRLVLLQLAVDSRGPLKTWKTEDEFEDPLLQQGPK